MKEPLLTLLPHSLQSRVPNASHRPIPVILASLLLGTLTHIVWDAFTHPTGWVVLRVPFLAQTAVHLFGRAIPAYTFLQHGSTAVGTAILLAAFRLWYRRSPVGVVPCTWRPPAWLPAALVIVPAGVACAAAALQVKAGYSSLSLFVGRGVVAYLAFLTLELLAFSIVGRRSLRRWT